MNVFFVIILAAILVDFGLDIVASLLNLKALRIEPPAPLAGLYKPEEYRKSQQYTRVNIRFGFVTDSFRLALLLAFWFSGGFDWLDHVVRGWGFQPIVGGLLYLGILSLGMTLLMLPFSIYDTFVIEERFGFNKTNPRLFVVDRLKGLALALVLGVPLLAAVLAIFLNGGSLAWLYCWAAVTAFSLIVEYVAPTWIMPLFNKFTPMPDGDLKDAILNYARSVSFPFKKVMIMDSSKRSTKSNAFFTGFGSNKRIVLFDTLVANHTVGELVAVLAHEIGHYKKKHVLQGTVIGIVHTGLLFFLLSVFLGSPGLYQAFFMDQPSIYAGLLFFGLLYTPLEMIIGIGMQMFSRKNEYEADRFAAATLGEPRHLADALKKLSSTNLSNLTPHPFFVFLKYSHPPLLQRVQAIEAAARKRSSLAPADRF